MKIRCDICNKELKKNHKKRMLWGKVTIDFHDGRKWVLEICVKCHDNLYNKGGIIE